MHRAPERRRAPCCAQQLYVAVVVAQGLQYMSGLYILVYYSYVYTVDQ
eukprot:COSAG06_NODE_3339_length_5482_cov_4.924091_6_plen_48_part_00